MASCWFEIARRRSQEILTKGLPRHKKAIRTPPAKWKRCSPTSAGCRSRRLIASLFALVSCPMGLMRPDRIPLFPLNVVLLPGAELPLHMFEPRYREMVRNARPSALEFGMLLSMPDGIARVGCTAEILEDPERIPTDGWTSSPSAASLSGPWIYSPKSATRRPGRLPGRLRNSPAHHRVANGRALETCHTLIFGDSERSSRRRAAVLFFPCGRHVANGFAVEAATPGAAHRIRPRRNDWQAIFAAGRRIYRK